MLKEKQINELILHQLQIDKDTLENFDPSLAHDSNLIAAILIVDSLNEIGNVLRDEVISVSDADK